MTKDEGLKLALDALEANQPVNYCMNNNGEKFPMMHEDPFRFERNTKAITAIKEALAQPEQEPVAWRYLTRYPSQNVWTYCGSEPETKPEREPLYTTPPQRKPCPTCEALARTVMMDQTGRDA